MQSEIEISCPDCHGKGFFPEVSFRNCSTCLGFGALLSGTDGIRTYNLAPVIDRKPMSRAEEITWRKASEWIADRELRKGFGS